ncbi:hypothetical protein [Pseudomonas cerasi]|uniref:hypothetical protein n=1 Tax=Pseudomonas cerasi TaxID=1583341 RepID=UPI0012FFCE76|nr:hypothetical protein [Pseudomonas cerasi]
MKKSLYATATILSVMVLAGCEKTSEDYAREAARHETEARAYLEGGDQDKATESSVKATTAYKKSKEAATTEDRHLPPDSDVPEWIKSTE